MAHSLQQVIASLLQGKLCGVAVATCATDGNPAVFYLNSADVPVLREPMDRLRVMYESNQDFADRANNPKHNRSGMIN